MRQTALITGASSGIGKELAIVFAKNNIDVILIARNAISLNDLSANLEHTYHIKTYVLAKDLSRYESVNDIYTWCKDNKISIDFLVNNAGFGDFGPFVKRDWEKQMQMIHLNITALTHLSFLFIQDMIKNKYGRVMNVSSTAAFQPGPMMSVYCATKAYVLHFSEAIANELEGTGVMVTALCPGATESGFQLAANLQGNKLFEGKKLPCSEEVAAYGYKAMMKGKRVAIHGALNYVMANSVRFTPRNLVVKIARKILDRG